MLFPITEKKCKLTLARMISMRMLLIFFQIYVIQTNYFIHHCHFSLSLSLSLSLNRSRTHICCSRLKSRRDTDFHKRSKEYLSMESVNFTSSVSAPKPSHHDELFMQQRMVFSESLNELKNLRKQLYSAAEYFELSYSKDDQKQIVVETLKDYTIKAFINTVDHLGSMADKVNNFVYEKTVDVSEADLKFSCIEQRQRTSQDFIDRSGLFQQSLAFSFPTHHKRYIIPGGAAKNAIGQSNLMYHSVENDWFQFRNATTREISPTIVSEENSTSTPSSQSSPKTFHLTRIASKTERREQPANHFQHSGLVKRSTTMNSSASKQRYPTEPWRSVSMSIHTERDRAKRPEHSGLNRRILKALVSMRKHKKDATLNKYNFNEN